MTFPSVSQRKSFIGLICSMLFIFFVLPGPALSQEPAGPTAGDRQASLRAGLTEKVRLEGRVRVIVRLADQTDPDGRSASDVPGRQAAIAGARAALLSSLSGHDITDVKPYDHIPFVAMQVDESALAALLDSPHVAEVSEDHLLRPLLAESGPLVGADRAWALGYTGAGWSVAVLDSGVDASHEFLSGKVVAEACFSSVDEASGKSGQQPVSSLCPNGQTTQTGSGSAAYCSLPGCDHGTHVAGIAAGRSASVNGIAKEASVIAVTVFSRIDDPTSCDGAPPCILAFDSDVIRGLEYVYSLRSTHNIASVNLSLGGDNFPEYCDTVDASTAAYKAAFDNLRAAGIATVAASGNEGELNKISAPACISSAVSVGSTGKDDVVSFFSNSAPFLSLLAPGENILSSVPAPWGSWASHSGTSMSTPHVAGAWAILKQKDPSASVDEVLSLLQSTGLPVTDYRNGLTKPRIRIDAALESVATAPVYRFFNTATSGHFFTISEEEKNSVIQNYPQFHYEGIAFHALPAQTDGAMPVYRFFNTSTSGHFFTISETERNTVSQSYAQFHFEGVGFYALPSPQTGAMPVYRFFNTATAGHFFTISEAEKNSVIQNYPQFHYEGVAFYAFPATAPDPGQLK